MKRDPRVSLLDIRESIERIEGYTRGFDLDRFLREPGVQDAVARRLEIIGEAVKNLPADVRAAHPTVRWADIAGLRDVLIHGYFGVSPERVWAVVARDLPALKTDVDRILKQMN